MAVTSRATLTEYCLRALGEPVVEINVDDSQLEERIDEALDYWNQYHFDGAEKMYLKQKITASRLFLDTGDSADFPVGTIITGATSGAKAVVCTEIGATAETKKIICKDVVGTFVLAEDITGSNGATAKTDVEIGRAHV